MHDLSLNMEIAFDVHQAAKFLALSSSELRKEMEQYLRVKHGKAGREGLIYDGQAYPQMETRVPGARRSAFCKLLVCFGRDLDAISEHLSRGLRSDLSVHERLKEFQALERFPIFREISSGFLISLLPPDGFRNLYQVRIELIARGKSPFVFEEGHISEEDTLRKFQLAQDLLNNRSIDIRLYRGSDGESSLTREAGFNETMPDSLPEAHVAQ